MFFFPPISQIDVAACRRLEMFMRYEKERHAENQGKTVIRSFWKNGRPWIIVGAQSRVPKVKRRIN